MQEQLVHVVCVCVICYSETKNYLSIELVCVMLVNYCSFKAADSYSVHKDYYQNRQHALYRGHGLRAQRLYKFLYNSIIT